MSTQRSTSRPTLLLAAALGLGALFGLGACRPQRSPDSPEQAARAFSDAVRKGEAERVHEALSERTRELLQSRLRLFSDGGTPVSPVEVATVTFGTGVRQAPLDEVKVIREEPDRVLLEVKAGARAGELRLVKEGGRWKVDLTPLLMATDGGW